MLDKTLEQRVQDLEDMTADIPHMVNLRMESLLMAQREASARMNVLDQQMTMVLREIRDLRGGVTRMLVAQDREIAAIKAMVREALDPLSSDVGSLKTDVGSLKSDFGSLKSDLAFVKADAAETKADVKAILAHLSRA